MAEAAAAHQPDIDIDHLRTWIGSARETREVLGARLADEFLATLDREHRHGAGEAAPLCIHWCLAPEAVPNGKTGPDGHPQRGGFLPPVPLPRRMWAGGAVTFHAPLRVGDTVVRRSVVEDVTLKTGRSGRLCFLTVSHRFETERGLAIEERQDIVYRDLAPSGAAPPPPGEPDLRTPDHTERVEASTLLLFRYSALTFNGHRIHYDRPYATAEEGYPGLVVHGPLQATFLIHAIAAHLGRPPRTVEYRGKSPLFDGAPFAVNVAASPDGASAWVADADGQTTMSAEAT